MDKSIELPAYSTTPETDKQIRFIYKKAVAESLSKLAKFDKEKFVNLHDTPATRLAAEFVAQYINKHMMDFTADALEVEAKNHIRQKHRSEKWISHTLKLGQGDSLIEQLRAPPVTHDSTISTLSPTKSIMSSPPKLDSPISQGTQNSGNSTPTKRIHVRVKKNKNGEIIEDPKEIIFSDKALRRISKKDRETLLTESRTHTISQSTNISEIKSNKDQLPPPPPEIRNRDISVDNSNIDFEDDSKNTSKTSLFPPKSPKRKHDTIDNAPEVKPKMFDAEIEPDTLHRLDPSDCRSIREARPTLSFVARINEQLQREAMQKDQEIEALKLLIQQKEQEEMSPSHVASCDASIGSEVIDQDAPQLSPKLTSRLSKLSDETPPTSPVSAASMANRRKVDLRPVKIPQKESDSSYYSD
ncbi:hypothetical protein TVAG_255190 [Trichomonas vaginalis G3]|uniref:Uncharacterized protein n=1 Tax=Trichomonas vaginalis (strain ATCC PRA-98 / G3) TaxID=412133 RepID=A2FPX9_TRIV3|nr:hypothetical protein TVAGG3_0089150 [Trichomonas vaginalis G3]EAX93038.1 hypothetical protein TVAG_255190 [Trichomonas vaginalis G3]KAI5543784.1 hypothetical protein TVAGG3_0089150 [Trichomonas vaginalis G3]|eukprot:XP_001305968.1 hypothetical protein [Trichomonas vaginalis G3]